MEILYTETLGCVTTIFTKFYRNRTGRYQLYVKVARVRFVGGIIYNLSFAQSHIHTIPTYSNFHQDRSTRSKVIKSHTNRQTKIEVSES